MFSPFSLHWLKWNVATPAGSGRKIRQHIERGSGGAALSLPLRNASTCNVNQVDYSCFKVLWTQCSCYIFLYAYSLIKTFTKSRERLHERLLLIFILIVLKVLKQRLLLFLSLQLRLLLLVQALRYVLQLLLHPRFAYRKRHLIHFSCS